jgi:hypothetical protein
MPEELLAKPAAVRGKRRPPFPTGSVMGRTGYCANHEVVVTGSPLALA